MHFPPNITSGGDYQYSNPATENSMCRDWSQDGSGEIAEVNCQDWGCSERGYIIWWMQNFPGLQNTNRNRNGEFHPNWWEFMFGGKYQTPPEPDPNWDEFVYLPLLVKPGSIVNSVQINGHTIFNHTATLPRISEPDVHKHVASMETAVYTNDQEALHKPIVLVIYLSAYAENGAAISPIEEQADDIIQQIRSATTYHGYKYDDTLTASFVGQDGAGYAGENCESGTANDNIHIHLTGIKESVAIANIRVTEKDNAGVWANPCVPGSTWIIHVENSEVGQRDLYFKPYRNAPDGTIYEIIVEYEDGSYQEAFVDGTAVSP